MMEYLLQFTFGHGQQVERCETIYRERFGHVLALKMDRLFRDVQDCLGSVDELEGIGVDIHILDQDGGTLDINLNG